MTGEEQAVAWAIPLVIVYSIWRELNNLFYDLTFISMSSTIICFGIWHYHAIKRNNAKNNKELKQ